MSDAVRTDTGPFSIIPEWVLDAGVSDGAIRLYCVLGRYADADGDSYPSRRTLAERMGCSTDTVDRRTRELVDLGALSVAPRYDTDGDRTSNLYRLRRMRPGPGADEATHQGNVEATGPREGAAENETHLERDPKNETSDDSVVAAESPRGASRVRGGKARRTDPRSDTILREWWDALTVKPVQSYVAARGVVDAALRAGWSEEDLRAVLRRIDPPLSGGRLDYVRSRLRESRGPGSDWDRSGESGPTDEYR